MKVLLLRWSAKNQPSSHPHSPVCQCRVTECSPDVLTQYNNEAKLCIYSTRKLHSIEFLLFMSNAPSRYQAVQEGQIVAEEQSSVNIEIPRGSTEGTIVTQIPRTFFDGMDSESITDGKAFGIAIINSAAGGKSEVSDAATYCEQSVKLYLPSCSLTFVIVFVATGGLSGRPHVSISSSVRSPHKIPCSNLTEIIRVSFNRT